MNRQLFLDIRATVFDSIRAHKLRAGLTLTGVVVGTATVALVGAVLTGFRRESPK